MITFFRRLIIAAMSLVIAAGSFSAARADEHWHACRTGSSSALACRLPSTANPGMKSSPQELSFTDEDGSISLMYPAWLCYRCDDEAQPDPPKITATCSYEDPRTRKTVTWIGANARCDITDIPK